MEENNFQKAIIKQLSHNLEDLESFIKDLWQFLPLPMAYLNPKQIILDANLSLGEFFGENPIDLIGQRGEIFFFNKKNFQKIYQEITEKKKILNFEGMVRTKKGKKIVNISASARYDKEGNFIGYYLAFADITELKTLQSNLEKIIEERTAQLREKKNKLEKYSAALMNILEDIKEEKKRTLKIINNFIDGILILDKEGKIILMNNEAGKILKLDPKNFIGKKMKELIRISELKNFPSLIEDNKEAIRQEICLNNEESEKKFLDVTSIYFSDIKERLIVFHDITREKMIEKIKSEFVSLAAHQLRTPLSAIKWTLRMFLDGDLGMLTQEQTEFIKKTFDSNEKMIALINDLLNVTRIEEGRYLYSLTPFDLIQGTQSVVDSYNEIIKQKKITMNLYFLKKKTSLVVMADKEKIKSVIENLIDNAIKYVLPGGKIEIFLEEKNNEVQFSIKDNGIGIPEDQKNRIFTKFFRAKNVKKIDTEGTGLGLFISKNIIEAHGGKIWFESKEGEGSNFYFILPIKK